MAPGTSGDTSGNTAACREYHLSVAATDATAATIHCPHASPDGGGVCVASTPPFCTQYQTVCVDTSKGTAYTDCATQVTTSTPLNGLQRHVT